MCLERIISYPSWELIPAPYRNTRPRSNNIFSQKSNYIEINIDIMETLKLLHLVNKKKKWPTSLSQFDVVFTLQALIKAQNELCDADEVKRERVKYLLSHQGYNLTTIQNSKWLIENGIKKNNSKNGWPEKVEICSSRNYFDTNFAMFKSLNKLENPWSKKKERLLYLPQELYLYFSGVNVADADVYLYINNNPNWDELPYVGINKPNLSALEFLFGKDLNGSQTLPS